MKKAIFLLISSLFVLNACQEEGSSDSRKKDFLISTEDTFYQYDYVDYASFKVSDKETKDKTSSFEIFLDNALLKDKESRWLHFGKMTLTFKKEDITLGSFEINVRKSSDYQESLSIVNFPKKTTYQKGEKALLEGLEVSKTLEYTRQDKEKVRVSSKESDYFISIDGTSLEDYLFDSDSFVTKYAIVTAKDIYGNPLSTSFPLYQASSSLETGNKVFEDEEEHYLWKEEDKTLTVRFSNETYKKEKTFYRPEEVNLDFNLNTLMDRSVSSFHQTPSLGEVPLLVVPVVLNGFEEDATIENHKKIEEAFFGKTKNSEDLPNVSLSSYYYYSSYKQLHFVGEVTPYFYPSKEGFMGYSNPYSFSLDTPASIAKDALSWAKNKLGINLDSFDSDNDGFVDGVWLIYLESDSKELTGNGNPFWPFTTAKNEIPGTKEDPAINVFSWAGASHLWGRNAGESVVKKLGYDPSVLFHETGHLLGLQDYYSYDPHTTKDSYYAPLGHLDMMDQDVGDHNPYSKMLLGWMKPYVVLGDAEIKIPSSQKKDSFFLLPYDNKEYQLDSFGRICLNPFDEYLLLDYYTYDNLLKNGREKSGVTLSFPEIEGARLYHADARVLYYQNSKLSLPSNPDDILNSNTSIFRAITNSQSGSRKESTYGVTGLEDYFDEIRLISKDKTKIDGNNKMKDSTLFYVGDSFSMEEYGSQFVKGKLDNKKTFSTKFTIVS